MVSFRIINIFVRVNQIKGVTDLKTCMDYFSMEKLLMFEFLFPYQIESTITHLQSINLPLPPTQRAELPFIMPFGYEICMGTLFPIKCEFYFGKQV